MPSRVQLRRVRKIRLSRWLQRVKSVGDAKIIGHCAPFNGFFVVTQTVRVYFFTKTVVVKRTLLARIPKWDRGEAQGVHSMVLRICRLEYPFITDVVDGAYTRNKHRGN